MSLIIPIESSSTPLSYLVLLSIILSFSPLIWSCLEKVNGKVSRKNNVQSKKGLLATTKRSVKTFLFETISAGVLEKKQPHL